MGYSDGWIRTASDLAGRPQVGCVVLPDRMLYLYWLVIGKGERMATIHAGGGEYGLRLVSIREQLLEVHQSVSNLQNKASSSPGPFLAGERDAIDATLEALSFVKRFFDGLDEIPNLKTSIEDDYGIIMELENLPTYFREIKVAAEQYWKDERPPPGLSTVMELASESIVRQFENIPVRVRSHAEKNPDVRVRGEAFQFLDSYIDQIATRKVLAQAEQARDKTIEVLNSAKKAAGEVGATEQAVHYKNFADSERRTATFLRYVVISILVAMAVTALLIVSSAQSNGFTLTELSKLAVVLPLAVLAAYLGRESGRHRVTANWAQELAMQLLTFDAFSAPLDENARIELRAKFAAQVFGVSTRPNFEAEHGPSVAADVIKLLETLGSIVGTNGLEKSHQAGKDADK